MEESSPGDVVSRHVAEVEVHQDIAVELSRGLTRQAPVWADWTFSATYDPRAQAYRVAVATARTVHHDVISILDTAIRLHSTSKPQWREFLSKRVQEIVGLLSESEPAPFLPGANLAGPAGSDYVATGRPRGPLSQQVVARQAGRGKSAYQIELERERRRQLVAEERAAIESIKRASAPEQGDRHA